MSHLSAKEQAAADRKRRRSASPSIDLSQSPPDSPVPAGAAQGGERNDEVPIVKREPRQAAMLAAALSVAIASPLQPVSAQHPPRAHGNRPARAAKSEASARLQAISVSLSDNREVSISQQSKKAKTDAAASARTRSHRPPRSSPSNASASDSDVQILDEEDDGGAAMEDEPEHEGEDDEAEAEGEEEEPEEFTKPPRRQGKGMGASNATSQVKAAHKSSRKSNPPRSAHLNGNAALKSSSNSEAQAAAAATPSSSSSRSRAPSIAASSTPAVPAPSSSSSSAAASRKRDTRRDKRISGFGAWRTVHKAHIPAVTYEGYEDLACETLEPATHAAIKNSRPYEPQGLDCYHRSPWPIIYGAAEPPLTLYRRVDTKYGRDEYKVKAQRNIEQKEVITFLGGRLMEQVKSSREAQDEWNQCFHMDKNWLKEFFEYPGDHSLVVSTKDHRSLSKYIRAPEERMDEGEGPNVKADVVLDVKGGLFFVIYYALEPIRRGSEIFCQPFLGEWHSRCHREMFLYSRVSHWYHKWALALEKTLAAAGVNWDTRKPSSIQPRLLTSEQEERFLNIPGMDQGVLPPPLPLDASMKIIDVGSAMDYCGTTYSHAAMQIDLSKETQHYIDAVGSFIPDFLDIKVPPRLPTTRPDEDETFDVEADEAGAAAAAAAAAAAGTSASSSSAAAASPTSSPRVEQIGEMCRVKVDKAAVAQLIRDGARHDLVELREDFGIHSPVRHFTPPNYRAFCVVAKQNIPRGTFVFCYAGEITEDVVHRDSAYVYTMEREQIRRTVRSYHGPDLYLDALKTYRMGEQEAKGCTANLETQFLFDRQGDAAGTIHLGFYTTRDVASGEELVSQYGEEYWKTINKQLISEHKKFFEYANPYTRKLERILFKRGMPLPAHPPDLWTSPEEEMFVPKLKPYPRLDDDDTAAARNDAADAADDSGAFEVERILNKRRGEDGQTWYKVKWKHHSTAHNEWIPEKNVVDCHDLVAEFNAASEAGRPSAKSTKKQNGQNTNKKK